MLFSFNDPPPLPGGWEDGADWRMDDGPPTRLDRLAAGLAMLVVGGTVAMIAVGVVRALRAAFPG